MASAARGWLLCGLALACLAPHAGCHHFPMLRSQLFEPAPAVFTGTPTLAETIAAVNRNVANVRSLRGQNAAVRVDGIPPLKANLSIERPRRFRLQAQLTSLTGTEVDLGSNDELFWMWVRRSEEPALFFARHDQFAQSPVRQVLPLNPLWLTDALGLVELDPAGWNEGPFPAGDDRFEVRSRLRDATGDFTRVLVVHGTYGWVLEQRVYDPRGVLVASARASKHRYYPLASASLPQVVELELPTIQLAMRLEVDKYHINQDAAAGDGEFIMPQMAGTPLVDLADPRLQFTPQAPGVPRGG